MFVGEPGYANVSPWKGIKYFFFRHLKFTLGFWIFWALLWERSPVDASSCRWGWKEVLRWRGGKPRWSRSGRLWNQTEEGFDHDMWETFKDLIPKVAKEWSKCKCCNRCDPTFEKVKVFFDPTLEKVKVFFDPAFERENNLGHSVIWGQF